MFHRTIRLILNLFALALAAATFAAAQSPTPREAFKTPFVYVANNDWQIALKVGSSKRTLFVVTQDQPQRRQTCHLRSFTADELVCSHGNRSLRTYFRQQVVALILPGDQYSKLSKVLWAVGFSEFGAAIWGSVVLAATCPACGVAAGIGTVFYFGMAALFASGEEQPDRVLYLAPGQKLTGKFRFVQPYQFASAPLPHPH